MSDDHRSFSLTDGGPFHRVVTRLELRRGRMGRAWWFGIFLWLPLMIGEGVRAALGEPRDPTLFDLSTHARLLFEVPMLLVSERLLEQTSGLAISGFYEGRLCESASLDRIVAHAERLRDAWPVEAILLALAVLGGQLSLWEVAGSTGWFSGGAHVGFWSFPRLWYASIALPIAQFIVYRWLWRWLIWTYILARISRLPLTPLATHADQAAGLGPLALPLSAFSGFVLATGAVLAGAWGTQLLQQRTTNRALLPELLIFLLGVLIVALGPLLLFCGHLFRARWRALAEYGVLVRAYTLRFHEKWIARPPEIDELMGSPEIQSLADIGNSFRVVVNTRLFVFELRNLLGLCLAGLLPAIPVLASSLTVEGALERVLTKILPGLPL